MIRPDVLDVAAGGVEPQAAGAVDVGDLSVPAVPFVGAKPVPLKTPVAGADDARVPGLPLEPSPPL